MNSRVYVVLTLVAFLSCSRARKPDYDSLNLAQVSGTITLDGEPLRDATVMFDSSEGRRAMGTTDSSGRYTLMHNSEQPGVTGGRHVVRIRTRPWVEGEELEEGAAEHGEGEEGTVEAERVPLRYNLESTLTADVAPGETITLDFDLESQPK